MVVGRQMRGAVIEPSMTTLPQALRRHSVRQGDRPALTFVSYERDPDGTATTLTYGEVNRRAREVAAALREYCGPGDVAAVLCTPGVDYVMAFLGCLYAGVPAVPLFAPDGYRDNSRLAGLLAGAAPACLLTTASAAGGVRRLAAGTPVLAVDQPASGSVAGSEPSVGAGSVAYLQFTSGSTASPRGVAVTHANLAHTVAHCRAAYELPPETVAVSWLPYFHDLGLAAGVTVPLFLGVPVVALSPYAFVQRPARWLRLVDRYRATFTATPNFGLDLCAERARVEDLAGVELSCLRVLLVGGEPVRQASLVRFAGAFGRLGFRPAAFTPSYGLAEATVLVSASAVGAAPTVLRCDRAALGEGLVRAATSDSDAVSVVSAGAPAGAEIAIVDPDTCLPLPPGRVGEVWVRGPTVAAGYLDRPEQTGAVFHGRLSAGRGAGEADWLRTGDLGFLHEGELFAVGRRKDVIVIDGRNHHPADIEVTVEAVDAALRTGHVAAFGVDVDGVERLVVLAEIEPRAARAGALDEDGLRRAVRAAVGRRHGVELHDLVLLRKGSIRRTSSGKLPRDACRRRYLDGGYRGRTVTSGAGAVQRVVGREPAEIESWLVRQVAGRLGVAASEVDPGQALADLGFSSVDAVAFTGEIERRYPVTVSPTLFWEYPSIRAVSAHLSGTGAPALDGPAAAGPPPAGGFEQLLRAVEQPPGTGPAARG
jgi:acyl-CoA synthetase (AMP-forming)/AMP-acid ligase II/acyl carrier protein